jgi:uncharacterized membrane protein YphA (DoxX/SURF4 family)
VRKRNRHKHDAGFVATIRTMLMLQLTQEMALQKDTKMARISRQTAVQLLLRAGLAIIFSYAAISSFVNPQDWVGYLPPLLTAHIAPTLLLHIFSVYELLLVVGLLSGLYVRYVAILCAFTLGGIVMSNFSLFAITFRDIALIFSALALAVLSEK